MKSDDLTAEIIKELHGISGETSESLLKRIKDRNSADCKMFKRLGVLVIALFVAVGCYAAFTEPGFQRGCLLVENDSMDGLKIYAEPGRVRIGYASPIGKTKLKMPRALPAFSYLVAYASPGDGVWISPSFMPERSLDWYWYIGPQDGGMTRAEAEARGAQLWPAHPGECR